MNRLKQTVVIALLLIQFSVLPSCEKTEAQPIPEPDSDSG